MKTICLTRLTSLTQLGFRRANARLGFRSIAMRLDLSNYLKYLSNLSNRRLICLTINR